MRIRKLNFRQAGMFYPSSNSYLDDIDIDSDNTDLNIIQHSMPESSLNNYQINI